LLSTTVDARRAKANPPSAGEDGSGEFLMYFSWEEGAEQAVANTTKTAEIAEERALEASVQSLLFITIKPPRLRLVKPPSRYVVLGLLITLQQLGA
jgi:hypothetical protein